MMLLGCVLLLPAHTPCCFVSSLRFSSSPNRVCVCVCVRMCVSSSPNRVCVIITQPCVLSCCVQEGRRTHVAVSSLCEAPIFFLFLALVVTNGVHCSAAGGEAAHGCVITTCEAPYFLFYSYILALVVTNGVHCSAAGGERHMAVSLPLARLPSYYYMPIF